MQKEWENTERTNEIPNSIQKEVRKNKTEIVLYIAIVLVILAIIIFLGISYYTYKYAQKVKLQLGAEIEKVTISSDGNLVYIKLNGGSNLYNLTKVKFTFTDEQHH